MREKDKEEGIAKDGYHPPTYLTVVRVAPRQLEKTRNRSSA